MDPLTLAKWIETLGPTGVVALLAVAIGRWFDKSFWPWFQKTYERQLTQLESILTILVRLDQACDDIGAHQKQVITHIEEMRRDIAGLYERQGLQPPSRQRPRER